MHQLLERQLRRFIGSDPDAIPEPWRSFIEAIDEAYRQADQDQALLERSLDLTSHELLERNERLREELRVRERAEAQLRVYAEQQAAVARLGQEALVGTDLQRLFEEATRLTAGVLDVEHCAVLELLSEEDALLLRAGVGWPDGMIGRHRFAIAPDGKTRFTLASGEPLIVEDFRTESRFRAPDVLKDFDIVSGLSMPIQSAGEPWGFLSLYADRPRSFHPDDLNFVQAVTNILAQSIERARTNRALKESEEQFRAITETATDAIIHVSETGEILYANPATQQILGHAPEDLLGLPIEVLLPEHLHFTFRRLLNHYLATGERQLNWERVELTGRHRDGRELPLEVSIGEFFKNGKHLFTGIVRDVSERKRAEQELRRSERKYRDLFERANLPILIFRPEDEFIIEANPEACRTYGFSREELIGCSLKELTVDISRGEEEVRHILEHGGSRNFETIHRTKDGRELYVLASCSLIEYDGKRAVLCFARDLTGWRRTKALLEESEARFRAVVEHASDAIVILDEKARFRYVSPASKQLLGYTEQELIDQGLLKLIHPEDVRDVLRGLARGRSQPDTDITIEFRLRHRDGSWRHLSARGKNLLANPGVRGMLGIVRDVTEMKRFEAKLIAARDEAEKMARLKSAFLANMSHEIRTPLTAILGFADLLAEEIDDAYHEFVRPIQEGGRRLSETLNSVLDLARLEADGFEPRLEPIDARVAVDEAMELFGPVARRKDLSIESELPEIPLLVNADRAALDRILNNLLSNAIKFTESGGIVLRGRFDADYVYLEVEDSGIGIDESFLPYLFDEFKQESTGLARSHEGTGLGLTITKRLVDLMNGSISVETRRGQGSRFTVTFPRVHLDGPPATPVPVFHDEAPQSSERAHILVVDDNADTRLLVERMLQPTYRLTTAAHGNEALEQAQRMSFDAVLLDINLGRGPDGLEVLQELRRLPGYAQVPIVALTAYGLPEDEARFREAGFDEHLGKPIRRTDLHRVLHQVLRAPRATSA